MKQDIRKRNVWKQAFLFTPKGGKENEFIFYAECINYEESQCDDWIKENMLKHTILSGNEKLSKSISEDRNTTVVLGSKADIRYELGEWLKQFDSVQFVSNV